MVEREMSKDSEVGLGALAKVVSIRYAILLIAKPLLHLKNSATSSLPYVECSEFGKRTQKLRS